MWHEVFFFIPVTGYEFPVTRNIFPVTENKFPLTGNKSSLTGKNFLSQEEQRTPHVTGKIFYYVGNTLPATGYIKLI